MPNINFKCSIQSRKESLMKEFEKELFALSDNIKQIRDHLLTEEATKQSLVLPFLKALGYNYWDPREVVPEFTADINSKNLDKVDYVIMVNS